MPSPFPGMDPWLESADVFPDLHERLVIYLSEVLNALMPPGYVATTRKLVWVDPYTRREPDVSVLGRGTPPTGAAAVATLPGLLELGEEEVSADPVEVPYLEILTDRGKRVVTAFEVLSPANKAAGSPGRTAYLDKQQEYRLGGVNIVEIDLLRAGAHTTAASRPRLEQVGGEFDYHASVRVAGPPVKRYAAPIKMTDRLPAIGIPLDRGVPPVTVDLQPLLDRAYDTGRYPELVRYDSPPEPPLTAEQAEWAAGILKGKV